MLNAGTYYLEHSIRQRRSEAEAEALVPVVEGTTLPAKDRVQAGTYLGWLGDPRPGVCTLPPEMVRIEGGEFVIGIRQDEQELYAQAYKHDYPGVNEQVLQRYLHTRVNSQPLSLPTFEIARYPITNAQWKLFIDNDGYDPDAPWWDNTGQMWLLRDDHATDGLILYQRRDHKQHPELWHDERFGIARPNHPVVSISWYEAVAFCRWLTQHPQYNPEGYVYLLPSEAEWEYAARRVTRRTYPWGNEEPDAECANFNSVYQSTTAVGGFAPGAPPEEGIHELAGNVWEWTRSVYRDYPYDPTDGREDTDNPTDKTFVLRGGGWSFRSSDLRASSRYVFTPDDLNDDFGCRLARRLPEA